MPPPRTLGEIPKWVIRVRCACGRSSSIFVWWVMRRAGPSALIEDVVSRMRCESCGGRPIEADVAERSEAGAYGIAGAHLIPTHKIRVPER